MKYLLFLFLSLFSLGAFANSTIGDKNVTKIIMHDSHHVYVYFSGKTQHAEDCDYKNIYLLPKEHPLFKEMYSGLLAAMHSGAKVNGYVNGCYNVWGKTHTRITRLDFTPNNQ